jgi:hypothetical protein
MALYTRITDQPMNVGFRIPSKADTEPLERAFDLRHT